MGKRQGQNCCTLDRGVWWVAEMKGRQSERIADR